MQEIVNLAVGLVWLTHVRKLRMSTCVGPPTLPSQRFGSNICPKSRVSHVDMMLHSICGVSPVLRPEAVGAATKGLFFQCVFDEGVSETGDRIKNVWE